MAILLAASTALAACSQQSSPQVASAPATSASAPAAADAAASDALPLMVVHKSPTCGCCELWVEHVREAGFPVQVRDTQNVHPVKQRLGVPYGKGSCHTAEVGGYVIEGHVPAEDIKRLLAQRPDARGLVLPGMEMPDGQTQPYTVELVTSDGITEAFAQH
ncbi:DUF411 domain-containing protein [Luteimonas sp. B3_2_R+30]|uniref:DUF411 domain-containing protein n=1 Tax=Luteimonas salinilitoris TaxID=3237697 RepID=A0ABV4HRB8_9GAMM